MTGFGDLLQPDRGQPARAIHIVNPAEWAGWLAQQPPRARAAVAAHRLTGKPGDKAILPGDGVEDWSAVLVCDDPAASPWRFASLGTFLPAGSFRVVGEEGAGALGWLLGQYRFDRYRKPDDTAARVLFTADAARREETLRLAEATATVRDLVNTPASDCGPADLEAAAAALAKRYGATLTVTRGDAHALALAGLVMAANLPVRLHLLVPAVENSIAGNAFRPGDVLRTRAGLTVENTNTDAEGRLILGDALTRAGEEMPELILDYATLTGAARVALGPDLPPLFSNDDRLAEALLAAGTALGDPLWRMPLWNGYDADLKSDIADMINAPEGGMAGAVTAALFLRRFVPRDVAWAHMDVFAWRPAAKPGRPKGGDAFGLRAAYQVLKDRYAR